MSSFFYTEPAPAAEFMARRSDTVESGDIEDATTNLMLHMPKKNTKGGKRSGNNVLPLLVIGGIVILLAAGASLGPRIIQRIKLKFNEPTSYQELKDVSIEFRNELVRWRKLYDAKVTVATTLWEKSDQDRVRHSQYKYYFLERAYDVEDYFRRAEFWDQYVVPYLEAVDISLIDNCAREFKLFQTLLQVEGYEEDTKFLEFDWKGPFAYDKKAFRTFLDKVQSQGNKQLETEMKFFQENVNKLMEIRDKYLGVRGIALEWLKDRYPDIISDHPNIEATQCYMKGIESHE